jgi:hypothetical protein
MSPSEAHIGSGFKTLSAYIFILHCCDMDHYGTQCINPQIVENDQDVYLIGFSDIIQQEGKLTGQTDWTSGLDSLQGQQIFPNLQHQNGPYEPPGKL